LARMLDNHLFDGGFERHLGPLFMKPQRGDLSQPRPTSMNP
jgi:hypothetical protein